MPTQHLLCLTKGGPLTEALPASGEGRASNPRGRETGVATFKIKKAAALGYSDTLWILYSPNVGEEEFCELRELMVLGSSLPASDAQATARVRRRGMRQLLLPIRLPLRLAPLANVAGLRT